MYFVNIYLYEKGEKCTSLRSYEPKHLRQSACLLVCTYRYIMWKTCLKNKSESKGQKKLKKDLKRRNQLRAKYQVHVIYCQSCRYVINLKPNKINNRDTFRWSAYTLDVINAWKHRIVYVLRDNWNNTAVETNAQGKYNTTHLKIHISIILRSTLHFLDIYRYAYTLRKSFITWIYINII